MLHCVARILRVTGIENRESSVGARTVAHDFIEQVKLDQASGCRGCGQRKSKGPEKAILEGSTQRSNKRKPQCTCFVVVDIII